MHVCVCVCAWVSVWVRKRKRGKACEMYCLVDWPHEAITQAQSSEPKRSTLQQAQLPQSIATNTQSPLHTHTHIEIVPRLPLFPLGHIHCCQFVITAALFQNINDFICGPQCLALVLAAPPLVAASCAAWPTFLSGAPIGISNVARRVCQVKWKWFKR